MELKQEIISAYNDYVTSKGVIPNIANVKIKWNDEDKPCDLIQEICLDDYEEDKPTNVKDEDILYYCSSVNGLLELTHEDNGSDFIIVEFISFDFNL
jgi:hypothetical protein